MTTDGRPRRATVTPSGATRRSSHAAAGGRILAAGVSASVAVGLVAVMARPRAEDVVLTVTQPQAAATPPETAPTTAPPRVVVVIVEDPPAPPAAPPRARTPAPAAPAPPPSLTVPAPPATLAAKPAVTPATAKPDTKTRAS